MGPTAIALLLILAFPAFGQQTAHIAGSFSGHRPSGARACIYEVRLGGRTYEALHNGAKCVLPTGSDFPATLEKGRIVVAVHGKPYKLEVVGTHE